MSLKEEGGNIYYELYIDIFILVNFMMNFVVLTFSKKILKYPVTRWSISLGALAGALLTGIVVSVPLSNSLVKFILFHGPVNIVMITIGLRIRSKSKLVKAYIVVYVSSFLVGGIFTSIHQYFQEASVFFVGAFFSYLLALGIWNYISQLKRFGMEECEVLLCNGEIAVKVKALIDTGNRLKDDLTGKPVNIISKETAAELYGENTLKGVRYISYRTIGKKAGVMPVFTLDNMCLYLEEEVWINQPLVAVSEENFCEGGCNMILNPDVK